MTYAAQMKPPDWLDAAVSWLSPRRLRAQALVLAICSWGVVAVDYATPGLFDRAGNIKFQDFLQFPVAARLLAQGRASELFDEHALADGIRAIVGHETRVHLQYFYGPQVALPFVPLAQFPFLNQARIWVTLSLLLYFGCLYLLWKTCRGLTSHPGLVLVSAVAYPPLFHFFVRGQLSVVALVCFSAAFLAFRDQHDWLAGMALGCLAFKPQFLVAVPLVLLLAKEWRAFAGLAVSAAAQLGFAQIYFGPAVMRSYFSMLLSSAGRPATTELTLSPIQMHSLRSFWTLLIPEPRAVWVLYIVSSLAVVAMATAVWRSSSPLAIRFSTLLLAAVLVNPHIYIYDLLALAPAFLILGDWFVNSPRLASRALRVLLYLAFVLPLFGPLARWTHVQLSVIAFAALLWEVWRCSRDAFATPSHRLAVNESTDV